MQGEFRGDFTRDTFNSKKHFSRVLMQQGRVQLDADWNEQTSILLHYLRTLSVDLIGPHAGPPDAFTVAKSSSVGDFVIKKGHYYVNGFWCENEGDLPYTSQPDNPDAKPIKADKPATFLVYLDVWERHVSYLQDTDADNPSIREVALGGPDTATRARVVWQVKVKQVDDKVSAKSVSDYQAFLDILAPPILQPGNGQLKARARKLKDDHNPCVTAPESSYRGAENQLYRVEIHRGNVNGEITATFKWSRENASVAFRVRNLAGDDASNFTVDLDGLGRDARLSLMEGDWVEIVDDDYILRNLPEPLLRVLAVDRDNSRVTLKGSHKSTVGKDKTKHPLLRRWDQKQGDKKLGGQTLNDDGTATVVENSGNAGAEEENWLTLEDGVQIQFQTKGQYQSGDYWLIPARTATGDVEWPGPVDKPDSLGTHGVKHHYAPLSIIAVDPAGNVTVPAGSDCRRKLIQLWT